MIRMLRALGVALLVFGVPFAHAQNWPTKVVKIVVPYPPGTGPDIVARAVADRLSKNLNQNFIVDNKAGANAIIGTDSVVKAPADGHTLLIADRLTLAVNPLLYSPLPYDPRKDLVSISNVSDVNLYLVINASVPARTFMEFLEYARSNPGKLAFGSGGNGSVMHLNMEAIQVGANIRMLHVPYKAFAEALPALVSGTVQVSSVGVESIIGFVREGRLRLLAVGADKRVTLTPDIPTIVEAGGTPDMLLSTSFSMHARAGAPAAMLEKISAEVQRAMSDGDLRTMLERRGQTPQGSSPQALDAMLEHDAQQIGRLIRERGITR